MIGKSIKKPEQYPTTLTFVRGRADRLIMPLGLPVAEGSLEDFEVRVSRIAIGNSSNIIGPRELVSTYEILVQNPEPTPVLICKLGGTCLYDEGQDVGLRGFVLREDDRTPQSVIGVRNDFIFVTLPPLAAAEVRPFLVSAVVQARLAGDVV